MRSLQPAALMSDMDILDALRQFRACLRPGGACFVSVRDYAQVVRDDVLFQPVLVGIRTAVEQGVP